MEWNGQVTFVAEIIIYMSSSNDPIVELQLEQIGSVEQKKERDEM